MDEIKEYLDVVTKIKHMIKSTQYRAILGANKELILLYYSIGQDLIRNSKWGNKFIDNLANDIKISFPELKGYSRRNLKYMKKFATEVLNLEFVQTACAQLTWSHIKSLLDKTDTQEKFEWYAYKTIQNGWSLSVLENQIATNLFGRQRKNDKIQNFELKLPTH